jgi:hypothetical protein
MSRVFDLLKNGCRNRTEHAARGGSENQKAKKGAVETHFETDFGQLNEDQLYGKPRP